MSGEGTGTISTDLANVGKVRLLIGDNDNNDYILTNNDILYFLEESSDEILLASIKACEAVISICGRKVTKKIGDQSVNWSDLQEHFIKVCDRLKNRYQNGDGENIPMPSSKTTDQTNLFTREMFVYS